MKPKRPLPKPSKSTHRSYNSNYGIIVGLVLLVSGLVYWISPLLPSPKVEIQPEITIIGVSNDSSRIAWDVKCAKGDGPARVRGCSPQQCRRVIFNNFTTFPDTMRVRDFMERVMAFGGGNGGPTIFDVHQGALSTNDKFVDIYAKLKALTQPLPFEVADVQFIAELISKIKQQIEEEFGVSGLLLTSPTFFSRISADLSPKTINDEYWHAHVDTKAYGSFVYTSLLYLSEEGVDFRGGSFAFLRSLSEVASVDTLVRPALGRLSVFTSGSENPHLVQKVTEGTRYAFTVAFSCDPARGLSKPLSKAFSLFDAK